MRVLIAEDEPLALEGLGLALAEIEGVEVVGTAMAGDQALDLIVQLRPDLAILDIAMPRLTGLDVARRAAQTAHPPLFAFLTAYSDFAVSAFELDALDYLLKPFSVRRIAETIQRARARSELGAPPHTVQDARASDERHDREFWVPTRLGVRRLAVSDVLWMEAARDYVLLHSVTRTDIIRARMNDLEARLDPSDLLRVHRSYFVSPSAVVEAEQTSRNQFALVLRTGARVEVGRSYCDRVRQRFPALNRRLPRRSASES